MSIFSLVALAVAFGVFAGQVSYDLVSGFIAEHRDRRRRQALLTGIRSRIATARNEQRRSSREGPLGNGARRPHEGATDHE